MNGRVGDKVALISGAARGQGRAHAVKLAEEGADIIAFDLCAPVRGVRYAPATYTDLEETAKLIESLGRRVMTARVDTRDGAALGQELDAAVDRLGRLDVVVANAGICIVGAWDEISDQNWSDTLNVNLTGVWNTAKVSIPHLISTGGGSIILVSSAAGLKAQPFLAPYVASKWGVTGLGQALALELAKYNIRVNTLHPTGVRTGMVSGGELSEKMQIGLAKNPALQGTVQNMLPVDLIEPEDVSQAVIFLASEESRYVTAHAMTVDAGTTRY
jgi:SDR family mycofactocin-dependent oxidoreductase